MVVPYHARNLAYIHHDDSQSPDAIFEYNFSFDDQLLFQQGHAHAAGERVVIRADIFSNVATNFPREGGLL